MHDGTHLTGPMQRTQAALGRPLRDELVDRYENQGQTTTEIGAALGVSGATVSRWMARLGITARFPGQRGRVA